MYSPLYAKDSRSVKAILWSVMLLEAAQSCMNAWNLVHYATLATRDVGTLFYLTKLDCWGSLLMGLEGALVHTFLAARCSQLFVSASLRLVYNLAIAVGTVVSLVGAVLYLAFSLELRAGTLHSVTWMNVTSNMWLWGTAFVCSTITAGLVHSVRNRAPGLSPDDRGIARGFRLAVEVGAPSTLAAVLGASLSYILSPTSVSYSSSGAFFQPLCSFYALALLSSLAHRSYREPVIVSVATLWDYGEKGQSTTDLASRYVVDDDQFAVRHESRESKRAGVEQMMSTGRFYEAYGTEKGETMFHP